MPIAKLATAQSNFVHPYSVYYGHIGLTLRYQYENGIGLNISHGVGNGFVSAYEFKDRKLEYSERWEWLFPELLKFGLSYEFQKKQ